MPLQIIVALLMLTILSSDCSSYAFSSPTNNIRSERRSSCNHAAFVAIQQQEPRTASTHTRSARSRLCAEKNKPQDNDETQPGGGGGILNFLLNPYESKIPKEIEKEIYAAEANTPAAKERGQRIALYAVLAFVGILCAFFNGFLTELRTDIGLDEAGFGWVTSNFLWDFLFTNKIGGLLCLLGGGAAGLLAEAEYDTRRINAEKIFEELQRRRAEKEAAGGSGSGKRNNKRALQSKKKKGLSGKEQKRMSALSEVVMLDNEKPTATTTTTTNAAQETAPAAASEAKKEEPEPATSKTDEKGGIFGTIKGFYEKADSMAASQALLLNKKLEDQGLIEKITDESGLKVIGKEEAAKQKQEAEKEKKESS